MLKSFNIVFKFMQVKLKSVKNDFCNFFCYIFAIGFGSDVATTN